MAYRRKQPAARVFTLEDSRSAAFSGLESSVASPSLAARAMQASAAHRDSSFSVYGDSTAFSPRRESNRLRSSPPPPQRNSSSYEYTSMKNLNESKYGFWGTLARKARTFVDNDDVSNQSQGLDRNLRHTFDRSASDQPQEIYQKIETTRRRADAIGSSLNHIGGTIKNALEEGLTIVENKTADIIHETKKLNIRRKGNPASVPSQPAEKSSGQSSGQHIPPIQTDYETQLKASRDVANAMAAKAKLLLRELKTVKADLAFAKERCTQLEEENKVWRESQEKGDSPEDDDLIRLQLETLLAEKARLAHENSMYSRENRFLREIVEYHQLTMQDVVYVDEGIEEVTEVYMTPNPPAAPSPTASPANVGVLPIHPNPTHAVPSVILPQDCPIVPTPPISSPLCDHPNTIPLSPVVAGSLA